MPAATASSSQWRAFFTGRIWRGRPYLISPLMDLGLAGGFALLAFPLLFILLPKAGANFDPHMLITASLVAWAAYAVNDPHFMVSYQLMYGGYGAKLRRFRQSRAIWLRYIVSGLIVPALLISYFAYALWVGTQPLFSLALTTMYIFVGWHYAKQAFGVCFMLSAMKKNFYGKWQRRFLLLNSYLVWLFNAYIVLCGGNKGSLDYTWGFGYASPFYFEPPLGVESALVGTVILGALASLIVLIWGKKAPSLSAITAYFSVYFLLFLSDFHPAWVLLFPFFHSLQYLMFVFAYKRGETSIKLAQTQASSSVKFRLARFLACNAALVLLGFVLPHILKLSSAEGSFTLFLAASVGIFINIHHYFIDNVIWRKEHTEIAQYLFHKTI